MNKPIKPEITIPQSFAENGVKTDFDDTLLADGFDNLRPDVLAGDNLNKFIDDTYKGLNYSMAASDALNILKDGHTLVYEDGELKSKLFQSIDNQITNCLLEVPQNIKYEFVDGVLTIKAGTKVFVPNGKDSKGNNIFQEVIISQDVSTSNINATTYPRVVFINTKNNNSISLEVFSYCKSGTSPEQGFYYQTDENKMYVDNTLREGLSLPLMFGQWVQGVGYTSIDAVFNHCGFIGSAYWITGGIKGLFPEGLNEDGTYKNLEKSNTYLNLKIASSTTMAPDMDWVLDKSGGHGFGYYVEVDELPKNAIYYGGSYRVAWLLNRKDNLVYQWDATTSKYTLKNSGLVRIAKGLNVVNGCPITLEQCKPIRIADYNKVEEELETKIGTSHITNCLIDVPKKVDITLKNGTLTLKKDSKVLIPNGVNRFEEVTIGSDLNYSTVYDLSVECYACYSATNNQIYIFSLTDSNLSFDATNNKVVHNSLTNDKISFPFAIVRRDSTGISKVHQVFNGIGFLKSTVWVDKGVKGLLPNGRNVDGTLINNKCETRKVLTYTNTSAEAKWFAFKSSSGGEWSEIDFMTESGLKRDGLWTYDASRNMWTYKGNALNRFPFALAYFNESYNITHFAPKQTFQAMDYSDKPFITKWGHPNWGRWTDKVANTVYRAEVDGWLVAQARTSQVDLSLQIDGVNVGYCEAGGSSDTSGFACLAPVCEGQNYALLGTGNGTIVFDRFAFMPCIGSY